MKNLEKEIVEDLQTIDFTVLSGNICCLIEEMKLHLQICRAWFWVAFLIQVCGVCRLRLDSSQNVIERHREARKGKLF